MPMPPTTSLFQAATSTFESLALLFPEERPADGVEFIPMTSVMSVTYRGECTGRVVIGASAGVLEALAENMLGAAAAPDPSLQRDALGEVANVITGNVLPMMHGARAVFHLDAPAERDNAALQAASGETRLAVTHLEMDEGTAVVAMFEAIAGPVDAADATSAAGVA